MAKGAAEGTAVLKLAVSAICYRSGSEGTLVVGWVGEVEGCGSVVAGSVL